VESLKSVIPEQVQKFAPTENFIKLFFSSLLTLRQNKLERLPLAPGIRFSSKAGAYPNV
jgi:hypothetical protein